MSNFPCSLTRNTASHGMENLAIHSLLEWKIIVPPILATSLIHFLLKGWDNVLYELRSERVNYHYPTTRQKTLRSCKAPNYSGCIAIKGFSLFSMLTPSCWEIREIFCQSGPKVHLAFGPWKFGDYQLCATRNISKLQGNSKGRSLTAQYKNAQWPPDLS